MANAKNPRPARGGGSDASRAASIEPTISSQPPQHRLMSDKEIMRALWGPGISSTDSIEYMYRLLLEAETDDLFWRIFQIG